MDKEKAIKYCERKIPIKLNKTHDCRDCYWSSSLNSCEIYGETRVDGCYSYLNDVTHGNLVKKKILTDQKWCIENWSLLDEFDKWVYCVMYGEEDLPLNIP